MHIYLTLLVVVLSQLANAQTSIETILQSVEKNNKTIASHRQLTSAQQLEYQTGIAPEDPFVSADYMIGRPVSGGNQLDILASQRLDFPTVYGKRKNLSQAQIISADLELEEVRREVLLEAKMVCLELIYLNKLSEELKKRISRADSLTLQFKEKLEQDDINALGVNKSKIQLLNLKSQLREIESKMSIQKERLTALNGGMEITFDSGEFEEGGDFPDFETLKDSITNADAHLQALHQDNAIYQANLELTKAMRLPEIEFGYHYQSVLGQTFNGGHFGLSIPLWQHKNTVKAAQTLNDFGAYQVESYTMQLHYELRELYDRFKNQEQTLKDYEEVLSGINSEEILDQLLKLGDIDYITYVQEMEYFYDAKNNYLALQKELHTTLAEIFKYQL